VNVLVVRRLTTCQRTKVWLCSCSCLYPLGSTCTKCFILGKGGKNRRRGKNDNEEEKRELVIKEEGQGKLGKITTSDGILKLSNCSYFELLI